MTHQKKNKKMLEHFLKGASGLIVFLLGIRAFINLENTKYENSTIVIVALVTLTITSMIYGIANLFSTSETLSKLFIVTSTARSPGGLLGAKYAIDILEKEKNETPRSSIRYGLVVLGILTVLLTVILLSEPLVVVDYFGWFAGTTIIVICVFLIFGNRG